MQKCIFHYFKVQVIKNNSASTYYRGSINFMYSDLLSFITIYCVYVCVEYHKLYDFFININIKRSQ